MDAAIAANTTQSFPYVSEYVSLAESSAVRQDLERRRDDQWKFQDYIVDDIKCTVPAVSGVSSQYAWWLANRATLSMVPPTEARKIIEQSAAIPQALQPGRIARIMRSHNVVDVLDPCVGWGETLLAAAISGVQYTGIVSAPEMQYYCEQIVHVYGVADRCVITRQTVESLPNRSFDMIIVSLSSPAVNRGDVVQTLLSSWVKLRPEGVMCLYISEAFRSIVGSETEISDAVDSFPDVASHSVEEDLVHVWTKSDIYTHSVESPTITLSNRVFDLHGESVYTRALRRYVRTLGDTVYVSKGYDEVAIELSRACAAGNISLHVHVSTMFPNLSVAVRAANKRCDIKMYSGTFDKELAETQQHSATPVLPWGLDSPGFVAVVTKVMQEDLTGLPVPPRVWLRVDALTVLRALLKVWPTARFLCWCTTPFSKQLLPLSVRHRVMTVSNAEMTEQRGKVSLAVVARQQGYKDDYIFSA